jgi:hypothetical protein
MRTVNLEDFSKELKGFAKLSLEKKRKAVIGGIARSIPDLVAASPVDTGLYAASWGFTPTETGAILGNYAPYAGVIEYGARPFTPPIGPLLAWAKRVLRDPSEPPHYSSEVWALAKGVQKKISEQGMQPKHIMEGMIPTIINNIREELKLVR